MFDSLLIHLVIQKLGLFIHPNQVVTSWGECVKAQSFIRIRKYSEVLNLPGYDLYTGTQFTPSVHVCKRFTESSYCGKVETWDMSRQNNLYTGTQFTPSVHVCKRFTESSYCGKVETWDMSRQNNLYPKNK